MRQEKKVLLLSIRPEFAASILCGTKTVELRRQLPRVRRGDSIAIYISSPIRHLIGTIEVMEVTAAEPATLWDRVEQYAGISRFEYDRYFEGANIAVGIFLGRLKRKRSPIKLETLRAVLDGFHPPQSFRYLHRQELRALSI